MNTIHMIRGAAAALALAVAGSGCVGSGDVAGPAAGAGPSPTARATVAARAVVDAPDGAELRLTPFYARGAGERRDLPSVTATLGGARSEQLPVEIEFGACLADPQRVGLNGAAPVAGECVLSLRFALVVEGAVVDTATLGPLAMRAGLVVTTAAVSLREAASLQLLGGDGAPLSTTAPLQVQVGERRTLQARIIDGAGRVRPARGVVWRVAPPGLATLSDSGALVGLLPGAGTIGAASGGAEVAYPVRFIRPPQRLRVEGAAGSTGTLRLASVPAGIQCTITEGTATGSCDVLFPGDTTVMLQVTPEGLAEFRGFAGDCTGDGTCQLDMREPRVVRAASRARFPLTVGASGDGSGVVTSDPVGVRCVISGGTASATGCAQLLPIGTEVALQVVPDGGSDFTGWNGACTGTGPCVVRMTEARTVSAALQTRQQLVVTGAGTGTGTVTSSPAGISCAIVNGTATGTGCAADFPRDSRVTLTAVAATGFDVAAWEGACAGTAATGACTVVVSGGTSVTARFSTRQLLTVGATGGGSGSITSTPAGIACTVTNGVTSGSCSARFPEGSAVALSAESGPDTDFVGWSGACMGAAPCTVAMTSGRTVNAALALRPLLTVGGLGSGTGTITSTPAGVSCTIVRGVASGSCSARFALGSTVSLAGAPASGSDFGGWNGACDGGGACAIVMTDARTALGTFTAQLALTIAPGGDGNGTVRSSPAGINCTLTDGTPSGTCSFRFLEGASVTLVAEAGAFSDFDGWSNACTGSAGCTVSMTEARTVGAAFPSRPLLTVGSSGAGSGSVTSSPAGIACTITAGVTSGACSVRFPRGTSVVLSVIPASGAEFGGWSGACTGTSACTVQMTASRTVVAAFQPPSQSYRLTVRADANSEAGGTVSSSPAGISCEMSGTETFGTCTADFAPGTTVTLSATAGQGAFFGGWGGDCSSTTCTVTMNDNRSVTARFFGATGIRLPAGSVARPPRTAPVRGSTPRRPGG